LALPPAFLGWWVAYSWASISSQRKEGRGKREREKKRNKMVNHKERDIFLGDYSS